MPTLPLLSPQLIAKAPQLSAFPTRARDGDAATLAARQQDSATTTFVVIPETYGSLHDSLSPGAIVGIVIASVIGFILLLLVIYTILGLGPLSGLVRTTDAAETKSYVSRSMLSSARPKSEKPKKKVPPMRTAEMLSIRRERTTRTSKRRSERRTRSPVVVEPMRRKREPSPLTTVSSSSGAGPAPRGDPLPSDYDEENEVVVIEENTPSSRRQSRKAGPSSRDRDGRRRRSSSRRSSYSENDDRRYRR
ncbi:hypothetical protein Trco_003778 [Trichoderma cornu-damae]|uniref:Uncharacterized protein n=1 Tax=Trichoderma cornu-damae TaxID=654480 RepID=A0A9P8QL86_9HYPO|nr:hypothetical protein Trco_003778 [Trichoderma cornu-damae]